MDFFFVSMSDLLQILFNLIFLSLLFEVEISANGVLILNGDLGSNAFHVSSRSSKPLNS